MDNSFIRTASSEKHDSKFLVITCSLMQSNENQNAAQCTLFS